MISSSEKERRWACLQVVLRDPHRSTHRGGDTRGLTVTSTISDELNRSEAIPGEGVVSSEYR